MENQNEYSQVAVTKEQLVSWPRVAAVSIMVAFSLPTFITGIEVYQGLTVSDTVWALMIGSIILTVIGGVMGAIGAKTRLSSYLLVRLAFGDRGAGIVNLAFALSLIGWFGVNIDLFSSAVSRLALDILGISIPDWPIEVVAGVCMTITTIFGFKAINLLASLMVPVLVVVTAMMFWSAHSQLSLSGFLSLDKTATMNLSEAVSAIVGAIIIGAIILPDITRFTKHWTGGVYTAFWAYMVVELLVLLVAAFAAAAIGQTEILDLMLALGLGFGAFVIVIAGSWLLNSLNLYSTVLSVQATWPKVTGRLYTCLFGIAGIVAAFFDILDFFITFLSFLAAIFVPVSGIIIVDFLFVRREFYQLSSLDKNVTFSPSAFIAWLLGAVIAVFSESEFIPALTSITVLDAVLISGAAYALLCKFLPAPIINEQGEA
ncbi:purine-cytosine permease family protein [Paraglaciecola sp. 2405UD69-4]|uniref:purine-cytosine permease family protein n=1 Tax=Paraglaciecola sp. 2405UD69-4 TaxID=3391836 RepID=UPI0039C8F501